MGIHPIRRVVLPFWGALEEVWLQDQLWVVCLGPFEPNFNRQAPGFMTS